MSEFNKIMNKKAVALKYDETGQKAPVIVASGKGHMAEKIVEIANSNDIPVYEDNSLASVLSQLELGCEIPEQLYKTVVDIYVYFLQFAPKQEATNQAAEDIPSAEIGEAENLMTEGM